MVDQLEHQIWLDKCPHEMNDDVKIVLTATAWFVCSKDHKIRLLAVDGFRDPRGPDMLVWLKYC